MPQNDHGRTQTLLLISKILDTHSTLSPFTLVLDNLEQPAKPLLTEVISRSSKQKLSTIFVSFETLKPPADITHFVAAYATTFQAAQRAINAHITAAAPARSLVIIDSLHTLLSTPQTPAPQFLLSLITPTSSLLAVHHADQPLASAATPADRYAPPPPRLIAHLATTVLTLHALPHVLEAQRARQRARPAPLHGLREEPEGTIRGVAARQGAGGVVVEMDHRRKSGRSVGALFVLRPPARICLLDEDADWRAVAGAPGSRDAGAAAEDDGLSFSLSLTERQRREREGVVLPYFDAQRDDGGPGEGGRILYDMGSEDDFDEEEDEI